MVTRGNWAPVELTFVNSTWFVRKKLILFSCFLRISDIASAIYADICHKLFDNGDFRVTLNLQDFQATRLQF